MIAPTNRYIGAKRYGNADFGSFLIGWMYMQVSVTDRFLEFDHPDIRKYYWFGEFECPDECHLCIPPDYIYNRTNIGSCKETVENTLVLYDLDNSELETNIIEDISEPGNQDDITIGEKDILNHTQNLKEFHVDNIDINEPWAIPEHGILFFDDRYLKGDKEMWMLDHHEYFSLEVWVRFDQDDVYDKAISQVMG